MGLYLVISPGRKSEFFPAEDLERRTMPAKETQMIHCTFHPKDGVSEFEVGALSRWVGKLKDVSRHAIVVEDNTKEGKHCHIALGFKHITDQDKVKYNFETEFKKSFYTDPRWNTKIGNKMPAIAIKAHHDLEGLVGGYLTKQDKPTIISMSGFNQEQLTAGKERRDVAIEKKKKHVCLKDNFTVLMIEKHSKHWNTNEAYQNMNDEQQVDYCFTHILLDGYKNYIHLFTKPIRGNFIKFWHALVN